MPTDGYVLVLSKGIKHVTWDSKEQLIGNNLRIMGDMVLDSSTCCRLSSHHVLEEILPSWQGIL